MSEKTRKTDDAKELLVATPLPVAYGAWESDVFDSKRLDELKLLLTVSNGFDGASIEIKSLVADAATPGKFYTELVGNGSVDEVSILAAVLTAEGNQIAIAFGCQNFKRVKFQAKRTGGTQGDLSLSVLGG